MKLQSVANVCQIKFDPFCLHLSCSPCGVTSQQGETLMQAKWIKLDLNMRQPTSNPVESKKVIVSLKFAPPLRFVCKKMDNVSILNVLFCQLCVLSQTYFCFAQSHCKSLKLSHLHKRVDNSCGILAIPKQGGYTTLTILLLCI